MASFKDFINQQFDKQEFKDYLLSEQYKKLRLIIQTTKYDEMELLIRQNYLSNDTCIEDLSDVIILLNEVIFHNLQNDKNMERHTRLSELRLLAKKLAHSKFREGYDFLHDKVELCIYEKPRKYFNVEQCQLEYSELLNFIWKPSVQKYQELSKKAFNVDIIQIRKFCEFGRSLKEDD